MRQSGRVIPLSRRTSFNSQPPRRVVPRKRGSSEFEIAICLQYLQ
jgi:hypothetical protein